MAGEFTKRVENQQTIWTCTRCNQDIFSVPKPRAHICGEHQQPQIPQPLRTPASSSNTPLRTPTSTPRRPTPSSEPNSLFHQPPPGYRAQFPAQHVVDAAAWHQAQMLQAEQQKQMMLLIQQHNQDMMKMQQAQVKLQQDQLKRQQEVDEERMNRMMEALQTQKQDKRVKCPKWEKDENPKHFFSRLRRWDTIDKGKGKYLLFIEALQESGRLKEKLRVELEEQNGLLDPDDENIIKLVIEKLETWYGKTRIHEACEAWKEFKNIKRNVEEPIDDFLLRFDTIESKLKSAATELPAMITTLNLLESVNVSSDQKQNILVNVKVENNDTILDDLKRSLRLLKGNLIEGKKEEEDDEVNFNRNKSFRQSKSRSKSRGRFQSRSFSRRRERDDEDKDSFRNHQRGRSRERSYRDNRRTYSGARRSYSRNLSRDDRGDSRGRYEHESVNLVIRGSEDEQKLMEEEKNMMILDSGTTKTVAGSQWMKDYIDTRDQEQLKDISKRPERRYFRFGNSVRYPSYEEISIPLQLGRLETFIKVSVVNAPIPLLLGRKDFKRLGLTINFETETVFVSKFSEIFSLETTLQNHLALPLADAETLDDGVFIIDECNNVDRKKKIQKIHQVLAHPKADILKRFFKNSSDNSKDILELVDEVSEECDICRRFRKTPSRPKVGLPVANDFNQCIALDLRERICNKEYILYCICTFSRLTRGVIIKDKKPSTIVRGILDCWVLGKGIGPGMPAKFLFDNGGEFNNSEVIDLAEKHGINMHAVTAAHSPFSNGLCEKNHEVVDRMMAKMIAGDEKLKVSDALAHALFAKNAEPNNKGFSSFQIVYGTNPTIPGITNSTPPSLSEEFSSNLVRKHLERIDQAREAFRKADNDEKIKRALKSRINSYTSEVFETGDKVYFKEKDKTEWSGPAVVIGHEGKIVFLKYGNNLRRVHMSKIIRLGKEFCKEEKAVDIKQEETEKDEKEIPNTVRVDEMEHATRLENENKPNLRPRRKVAYRRPDRSRRIIFKKTPEEPWVKALVTQVGPKTGTNQFKTILRLDNFDEVSVDFSEKEIIWEYEKFLCEACDKVFETKRGLRMHLSKSHEALDKTERNVKTVTFDEKSYLIENEEKEEDVRKLQLRFKEVTEERDKNEKWRKDAAKNDNECVYYAEIKETPENTEEVQKAKLKELENFDKYDAFEEVLFKDQEVLGTRYVLTEKPDKSIKARFVVKGFQEEFDDASDSPTSSRETVKVFLAVAANEGWKVECSDVRSAFLQSDTIDRDVFVEPPPERRKEGFIWKLKKPCYGLDDASRKWFLSFKKTLQNLGMTQSKREYCLFLYHKHEKLEGFLIFHVDDIISAGSENFKGIMEQLRVKYNFGKVEKGNFTFTGLNISQETCSDIKLFQKEFINKLETPEYEAKNPEDYLLCDDNRMLRKTQGQLSWLASQTRPDISFDSFYLSTVLNSAKLRDAKMSKKVIKKVKQEEVNLKFNHLGKHEDLHLEIFSDASLGNVETGMHTKSAMGYFICLANKNLDISPLHWKSCVIDKVAEDIKTAETLALEKALDDAIHFSNLITEIYTGQATKNTMPIIANIDSKSLLESIYSTKKVKRKTMRVVISSLQQQLQKGVLTEIRHCKSKDNTADIFTKKGVNPNRILEVLRKGSLTTEARSTNETPG